MANTFSFLYDLGPYTVSY